MKGTRMLLALCNSKDGITYGPILNTDGKVILVISFFLFQDLVILFQSFSRYILIHIPPGNPQNHRQKWESQLACEHLKNAEEQ